ncbi:MAG: hypothetical protein U0Q15_12335 [Kineosporiaceae bacterium]
MFVALEDFGSDVLAAVGLVALASTWMESAAIAVAISAGSSVDKATASKDSGAWRRALLTRDGTLVSGLADHGGRVTAWAVRAASLAESRNASVHGELVPNPEALAHARGQLGHAHPSPPPYLLIHHRSGTRATLGADAADLVDLGRRIEAHARAGVLLSMALDGELPWDLADKLWASEAFSS